MSSAAEPSGSKPADVKEAWEAKLPLKVQIGGELFRIVWAENDSLVNERGDFCRGLTNLHDNVIELEKGQELQRLFDTVRHEITHASNEVYGIKDKMTEEEFTERTTKAWNDVWIHNPKLVRWFNQVATVLRKQLR